MVLGVTGSIAGGKSSVCKMFRRLGAQIVSADALAREVVRPGSDVLVRLVERFGAGILTEQGMLDRAALADKVFADDEARRALNALTHPAIAQLAEQRLRQCAQSGAPLVIYEAPLLFEAGAEKRVDAVLVVKIDPQVQLRRLMARDRLDPEAARRRIAAQLSQQEKLARADYVIDNSGSLAQTQAQVEALFKKLTGESSSEDPQKSSP